MEGMIHGTVEHTTAQAAYEGDILQTDALKTVIPLGVIADNGLGQLTYWRVDDFDYAYIDWQRGQIVLGYKTEHFLPRGYTAED